MSIEGKNMKNNNNNQVLVLSEEVMEEIDSRLTEILEEMSEKHGAVIEEMFICLTGFAVELQETIESLNVEFEKTDFKPLKTLRKEKLEISPEQKAINLKMN